MTHSKPDRAESQWRRCPHCWYYWLPDEAWSQKKPPFGNAFYTRVQKAVCPRCKHPHGHVPSKPTPHPSDLLDQDIVKDMEGLT